ncbi:hypothetical protein HRI_003555500 [Hibiscus trionum]|uniref:GATA-type domain-containing protein n=1 Tax=Hibiscus trionum TaxID=183268 RepID=A0A9W7ILN3_HIBTR|nr:hypothetical protein HRI_003555500 [Hibiscus trionum]
MNKSRKLVPIAVLLTKTPLWRGGPAGPKSLCNACEIRSRKKKRTIIGLKKGEEKKSKKNPKSLGDNLKQGLY